jgi:D-lactate dehydrogenase
MKIAFFEIKNWEIKYLENKLKGNTLKFFEEELNENTASKVKGFDAVSVFIASEVTKKVLAKLPKLKILVTRSTGYDHVDIKECTKRKIEVFNVPYYSENTVAEHTFALILSLSRNIHKSYVRTTQGNFSIEGLSGFDLMDKTIGIIGGGRIGMHVARIARSLGMHVRVFDINRDNFLSEVINFKYLDLDELLKVSDIVTLHVPENKHTHHLIDQKALSKMKKGAILINTARGGLVDSNALLDALEKGQIGGAGLDVIEGEEVIKEDRALLHCGDNCNEVMKTIVRDRKIFDMENVVFTPHNAFNSKESLIRLLDATISNLISKKHKIN